MAGFSSIHILWSIIKFVKHMRSNLFVKGFAIQSEKIVQILNYKGVSKSSCTNCHVFNLYVSISGAKF